MSIEKLQEIENLLKEKFPPERLSGGGAWRDEEGGQTRFYIRVAACGHVSSREELPPDAYNVRKVEGGLSFSFGKEEIEVSPLYFFKEGEFSIMKFLEKEGVLVSVGEIVSLQKEATLYLDELYWLGEGK